MRQTMLLVLVLLATAARAQTSVPYCTLPAPNSCIPLATLPTTTSMSSSTTTSTTKTTTTSTSTTATSSTTTTKTSTTTAAPTTTTTQPSATGPAFIEVGGANADSATAVAGLADGGFVALGDFRDTVMVRDATNANVGSLVSAGGSDWWLARVDANGAITCMTRYGGPSDDYSAALAVDALGDFYAVGSHLGAAPDGTPSVGGTDITVAKFSGATCANIWWRTYGAGGSDAATAIAADGSGITVVGRFSGSITFGGLTFDNGGFGVLSGFVLRLSTFGAHVRSVAFSGTGNVFPCGIAEDAAGNLYMAGWFSNALTFAGFPQMFSPNSASDGFLVALRAADWAPVWRRQIGGGGYDQATAVAYDAMNGRVLVSGFVNGPVVFEQSAGTDPAIGGDDGFAMSVTADMGAYLWARRMGGTYNDSATALAVSANGDVLVGGYFNGTSASFGAGLSLTNAVASTDGFLARYAASGAPVAVHQFGGTSGDAVWGAGVLPSGAGLVAGSLNTAGKLDGIAKTAQGMDGFSGRVSMP